MDRPKEPHLAPELINLIEKEAGQKGRRLVFSFFRDAMKEALASGVEGRALEKLLDERYAYFVECVTDDTPTEQLDDILTLAAFQRWHQERSKESNGFTD